MSKFKPNNEPSPLSVIHLGVGSYISCSNYEKWLLVSDISNYISLVSLKDFRRTKDSIKVNDINWISEEEARSICNLTKANAAFCDFEFDTRGIKIDD